MTSVKDESPEHILNLLGGALEALRDDLLVELTQRRVPRSARGLRGSQLRLLTLAPTDGIRVTDLAVRLGMTKQALGEFANALEARGLLESVGDVRDKRVRLLRLTRAGRAVASTVSAAIDDIEQRWRSEIGVEEWDRLRSTLVRMHATAAMRSPSGS
jgi:DNA-binding MarR family transcriptional regulator